MVSTSFCRYWGRPACHTGQAYSTIGLTRLVQVSTRSSLLGETFFKSIRKKNSCLFAIRTIFPMCALHFRLSLRKTQCLFSFHILNFYIIYVRWYEFWLRESKTEINVIGLLGIVFHMMFFCPVIHVICTLLTGLIPWVLRRMCCWRVINIFYTKGRIWETQVIDMGNKSYWTKTSALWASSI